MPRYLLTFYAVEDEWLALPEADFGAVAGALVSLPWDVLLLGNIRAGAPNAARLATA